jgi:3-hydroxymyristoyl/3-hydroxydecanoyl-(acyl carrier protein) dehydratase
MPGVVLLDWVVQALSEHQDSKPDSPPGVWQIDQAKFLDPVKPGDSLTLVLTEKPTQRYQFELKRGLTVVASGSLSWVPVK